MIDSDNHPAAASVSVDWLAMIATHADDAWAWRRLGGQSRALSQEKYRQLGRPMVGLDGLVQLPLDALPELAPANELVPSDPDRLAECLGRAWHMLDQLLPEAGRETRFFVLALASGRLPTGRQSSGSSESCPWAIRIDCCLDDPVHLLADAIVHEAAHVKLRLSGLMPRLCETDDAPRFHHPWRTEARPLSAVLVACHAFVAVHGFHARRQAIAAEGADLIEATLRAEVAQTLQTLASAEGLTDEGHAFTALLRSSHETNCRRADAGPTLT